MSSTAKKYFDKEFKEKIWGNFSKDLGRSRSVSETIDVLKRIITQKEIILLEKRLAILILLKSGLSYRKIGELIDVHRGTISHVKKNFKKSPRIPKEYSPWRSHTETKSDFILPPRGRGRWNFLNS